MTFCYTIGRIYCVISVNRFCQGIAVIYIIAQKLCITNDLNLAVTCTSSSVTLNGIFSDTGSVAHPRDISFVFSFTFTPFYTCPASISDTFNVNEDFYFCDFGHVYIWKQILFVVYYIFWGSCVECIYWLINNFLRLFSVCDSYTVYRVIRSGCGIT